MAYTSAHFLPPLATPFALLRASLRRRGEPQGAELASRLNETNVFFENQQKHIVKLSLWQLGSRMRRKEHPLMRLWAPLEHPGDPGHSSGTYRGPQRDPQGTQKGGLVTEIHQI